MIRLTRTLLEEIETKLGIIFNNPKLLELALIHRSYDATVAHIDVQNNERLEYLGDAVLELSLRHFLYQRLPDTPEGKLTQISSYMRSGKVLGAVAEKLDLDRYLFMSKGERLALEAHKRSRPLIMASAFEAIAGAIYIDRGLGVAEIFLENCLFGRLPEIISKQLYLDPKSCLQELAQEKWKSTPCYSVTSEKGPQHNRLFTIAALCKEAIIGLGTGHSKADAEMEAARDALQKQFQIFL
jgi:ribonuclease-3